jgi:hypothetical protein
MAEEKEKAKDQETKKPASKKDELSEKDLDKASGGGGYKDWIDVNKV